MSQDSSFVGQFDLKSQAGVMSVLSAIRASKISPAEKNELRDLIFAYTNGGGDASVRISLEQKLNAHQITPVVMQRSGTPAPVLPFGTYRPTPNFKAPAATAPTTKDTSFVQSAVNAPVFNQSQPTSTPTPTLAPVTTFTPQPAEAPTLVVPEVVQSVPVQNVPPAPLPSTPAPIASVPVAPVIPSQPAPLPVTPVMSVPIPVAPISSIPIQTPTPIVVATPVATPAPAPTPVPPAPQPISEAEVNYLERIRQIKTAVNSKVGNPVNLVDINNEVGREYMNALLEAMKKLGTGAVSEMGPAMQRLESAYVAVEKAITAHQAKKQTLPEVQVPLVPKAEPTLSVVPPQPPRAPASTPAPVPISTRPVMTESTVKNEVIEEISVPTPSVPEIDIKLQERPLVAPVPPVRPVAPLPIPPVIPKTDTPESVSGFESNLSTDSRSQSLADTAKILTPQDLPDSASVSTGAIGDPLFTKEVDDGLHQLLSDWSLFKKSGLFGTGPKGSEHPLFKSISDLQVPLLLAGRFEGATQEIRQSITDYMNGWRYEQGIIYQPGETFEKYLRRVIRHILDLQKKRHQS